MPTSQTDLNLHTTGLQAKKGKCRTTILTISAVIMLQLSACANWFSREIPEVLPGTARFTDTGLHFIDGGTPGKPLVIFIHGTPGSWQAFEHLLTDAEMQACCHMLSVDRPGFGDSEALGLQTDIAEQTKFIAELLQLNQSGTPALVAGHSLGGTVATQLALDQPKQVGALLVISSPLDASTADPRWYHRLGDLPLIKQIIPRDLHLANEEMLALPENLQRLDLSKLTIPATIIQGGEDPLVPAQNADFFAQEMVHPEATVRRFPEDGHFIIWQQPEVIKSEIQKLLDKLEPTSAVAVHKKNNDK